MAVITEYNNFKNILQMKMFLDILDVILDVFIFELFIIHIYISQSRFIIVT